MQPVVRMIRPSSSGGEEFLPPNLEILEQAGFTLRIQELPPRSPWPFSAASIQDRVRDLWDAISDPDCHILLCARGGYGASDLLPFLPWELMKATPHKWLSGFSDISALHWALFTQLGWPSIHSPMPASGLWGKNSTADIRALIRLFSEPQKKGYMEVQALNLAAEKSRSCQGILLGGCLSVICSLSGTPWFPTDLSELLFYFEDTGENPGQLIRHWNQLIQNKSLTEAQGVIIGSISQHHSQLTEMEIKRELASRVEIPCWGTSDFGHISPNFPVVNGAFAHIENRALLNWKYHPKRLSQTAQKERM
ncbi:MAG: LD-carboxypeptidase [Deltaproteobacteria bacterium]|nr:LD-carboxypeptidase [Deltaproteobacteria bacterium]